MRSLGSNLSWTGESFSSWSTSVASAANAIEDDDSASSRASTTVEVLMSPPDGFGMSSSCHVIEASSTAEFGHHLVARWLCGYGTTRRRRADKDAAHRTRLIAIELGWMVDAPGFEPGTPCM